MAVQRQTAETVIFQVSSYCYFSFHGERKSIQQQLLAIDVNRYCFWPWQSREGDVAMTRGPYCLASHTCVPVSSPAVPLWGFQRNSIVSPFSMWQGDQVNGGLVHLRLRPVYQRWFCAGPRAARSSHLGRVLRSVGVSSQNPENHSEAKLNLCNVTWCNGKQHLTF